MQNYAQNIEISHLWSRQIQLASIVEFSFWYGKHIKKNLKRNSVNEFQTLEGTLLQDCLVCISPLHKIFIISIDLAQ